MGRGSFRTYSLSTAAHPPLLPPGSAPCGGLKRQQEGESASLGRRGEEWRRLPPRDTLSSLLPPPPSRGAGVWALQGLAGRAETTSPSNRSREFLGTRRHVQTRKPWPSRGSLGNLRVSAKKKRTDIPSSSPALAQPLSAPPPWIPF